MQAIYQCETRFDEERLIRDHLDQVGQKLKNPNVKPAAMADGLVRALACHILGYDVTFIHIYALQLAQKGNILEKKMGTNQYFNEVFFSHELLFPLNRLPGLYTITE